MTTTSISELVERLRRKAHRREERDYRDCLTDVPCEPDELGAEEYFVNPDGPEAAEALEALTRSIPTAAPDAAVERVARAISVSIYGHDVVPEEDGHLWRAGSRIGTVLNAARAALTASIPPTTALKDDDEEYREAERLAYKTGYSQAYEDCTGTSDHDAAEEGWQQYLEDHPAVSATTAPECPSCHGLNISCPEGCERDPATGELITMSQGEVIQADRDAAADIYRGKHEALRQGKLDGHSFVQAFRDHRLAFSHPSCEVERLREALVAARRAIGDHWAPSDCYATGPLTGNAYTDLVECPACVAIPLIDAALSTPETVSLKGDRV